MCFEVIRRKNIVSKIPYCAEREREYLSFVEWQHVVSLGIVGAVAALLAWGKFRPRKFSLERDTHCGCSASGHSTQNSIVFRARRGERPQITVKMK